CALPISAQAADPDQEDDEVLAITGTLQDATALAQQLTNLGYAARSLQELPVLGFALMRLGIPGGQDVPTALYSLRQTFPTTLFDANTLYGPQAAAEPRHYAKDLIGWTEPLHECRLEVDVGLIDTVVDGGHPALKDSRVLAKNFLTSGLKPAPPDHGTAIASLIVGDPKSNTAGLVPSARLYAAAIFGLRDNDRVVGTTDAIARAIDWLGQQGVRIVNLSLSGPSNQVLRLTMERAHGSGMILIAAAGNEGPNAAPVFPAGYAPVMAVTAVDAALQPYTEANRGDYIDLAAPGVDVWSARSGRGGRYSSGTSFAAPFVAASAAVLLALEPDVSAEAMRQRLTNAARDLGSPGRDSTFGWGLLQQPAGC
ncbi:MAG TPA: peptidase S8, partial [Kiloniellaceae bacterium]|nr:peptidase S8 [Kiloniellaceae bacterium]